MHEAHLMTYHLPKVPPPNTIIFGLRVSTRWNISHRNKGWATLQRGALRAPVFSRSPAASCCQIWQAALRCHPSWEHPEIPPSPPTPSLPPRRNPNGSAGLSGGLGGGGSAIPEPALEKVPGNKETAHTSRAKAVPGMSSVTSGEPLGQMPCPPQQPRG